MKAQETAASVILLWKTWSIHGFVLFSLCLQICLYFAAPFRKKTTNLGLVVLVWSAYQLSETAISRGLALIYSANKQQQEFVDLYTLWSAFFILHFGGADTITALAMEDNNLWGRSWFNFVGHMVGIVNVALAVPVKTWQQWPNIFTPALLILAAGIVKSGERIWSLTNASFRVFQLRLVTENPNPGPDYAAIVEDYELYTKAGIQVNFEDIKVDAPVPTSRSDVSTATATRVLNNRQVITKANHFFGKFKGMYVDMVFCCHDRKESRDLFLGLTPLDAFSVLDIEMELGYEAFYTKTPFLSLPNAWLLRLLCFIFEFIALVLWSKEHKDHYRPIDIKITYILLVSALLFELVAFIRFRWSDWKVGHTAASQVHRLSGHQKEQTSCSCGPVSRQWSESISQFNFIDYCIYERPQWRNKLFTLTGSNDMMDGWRYVYKTCLTNQLRDFIFGQLRSKSVVAEDLHIGEEVCSSRGSWILRCIASEDLDPMSFQPWIMDVEYDESLLIWHIATELCYETDSKPVDDDEISHRSISKILSDYMFYLLLRQPMLMSEIAPMAEVTFNDTSAGARQFFNEVMPSSLRNAAKGGAHKKEVHKEACEKIMELRTDLPLRYLKGDSKSILFDACQLAERLKELKSKKVGQWKFTSQIWVELLCYAAAQSPANVHAMQLCAGGELATLIRLLMLHLGLSNQFHKAKSVPRAELVVCM